MGTVEDVRKVLQDFLAPELHTISARIDALEKVMLAKFEAMDSKFEARFEAIDSRFDSMDAKIAAMDARFEAKFDAVDTKLNSLHKEIEGISDKLDLDRRLTKLESQQISSPAKTA